MSWLNGHTTLTGLSSSDKEMLATLVKLNKLKAALKGHAPSKQSVLHALLAIPGIKWLYTRYKERSISRELVSIDKLYLQPGINNYHPFELAAEKLANLTKQIHLIKLYLHDDKISAFQKQIELLRVSLIKEWRHLTTKDFELKEERKWQATSDSTVSLVLNKLKTQKQEYKSESQQISNETSQSYAPKLSPSTFVVPKSTEKNLNKKTPNIFYPTTIETLIDLLQNGWVSESDLTSSNDSGSGARDLVSGVALTTQGRRTSSSFNSRPSTSRMDFNKHHSGNSRLWSGIENNFAGKDDRIFSKDIVYLFFNDSNSYEKFKAITTENRQLNSLVKRLEEKNQIRVSVTRLIAAELPGQSDGDSTTFLPQSRI